MGTATRVLLVDDDESGRQWLDSSLRSYSDVEVVGQATNGEQAISMAETLQPQVILMDIRMPRMDGVAATRIIKTRFPDIIVIGVSAHPQGYNLDAMQKAGTFQILIKGSSVEDLYGAIRSAALESQHRKEQ